MRTSLKRTVHIYEHIKVQTIRDGSKNLFTESVRKRGGYPSNP